MARRGPRMGVRTIAWLVMAWFTTPGVCGGEADDELFDWLLAPDWPSSLTLRASFSDDITSHALSYAYDAKQLGRFSITGVSARADHGSRDDESRQWLADWESGVIGRWTIGVGVGAWETGHLLDTRDYTASLTLQGERFSVRMTPGYRDLTVSLPESSRSAHAYSLGANLRIHDFSIGMTRYDYSVDFGRLGAALSHRRFRAPATVLDLLFNLEKQRWSFDYRLPLQQSDIGLRFDRSTSALTDEDLDLATGYVDFVISPRWDGMIEIGRSAQADVRSAVASLGVGYRW